MAANLQDVAATAAVDLATNSTNSKPTVRATAMTARKINNAVWKAPRLAIQSSRRPPHTALLARKVPMRRWSKSSKNREKEEALSRSCHTCKREYRRKATLDGVSLRWCRVGLIDSRRELCVASASCCNSSFSTRSWITWTCKISLIRC